VNNPVDLLHRVAGSHEPSLDTSKHQNITGCPRLRRAHYGVE
tara:strand:- start:1330 stop:1455 length:126 start_codon:yes stop_codon:yes gene_type:complete